MFQAQHRVKMKRGMEEIADVSKFCVDHAAKVESVVTALSPMKKARTEDFSGMGRYK